MAHVAPTFDEKAVGPAMGFERSLGERCKKLLEQLFVVITSLMKFR